MAELRTVRVPSPGWKRRRRSRRVAWMRRSAIQEVCDERKQPEWNGVKSELLLFLPYSNTPDATISVMRSSLYPSNVSSTY